MDTLHSMGTACAACGEPLTSTMVRSLKRKKYCGDACGAWGAKHPGVTRPKIPSEMDCDWCGIPFKPKNVDARWCSPDCRKQGNHQETNKKRADKRSVREDTACVLCGAGIAQNATYCRACRPSSQMVVQWIGSIRWRAKRLGVPFELDAAWLIARMHCCALCGKQLVPTKGTGTRRPQTPSVDRLVPSVGYTKRNCHVVCFRCNVLKRDATLVELQDLTANLVRVIRLRLQGLEWVTSKDGRRSLLHLSDNPPASADLVDTLTTYRSPS